MSEDVLSDLQTFIHQAQVELLNRENEAMLEFVASTVGNIDVAKGLIEDGWTLHSWRDVDLKPARPGDEAMRLTTKFYFKWEKPKEVGEG